LEKEMLYILIGASITLTLIGIFIVLWLILTGHSPILLEIAIGVIGGSQVVNTSLVAFFIKSLYKINREVGEMKIMSESLQHFFVMQL